MTEIKDTKVFKSPKTLLNTPRFHEPLSSLIFPHSPSIKSQNDCILQEQILDEVVDIIVTEEKNVWITGLILLFFSIAAWVASTQILNITMKRTTFSHPLFQAYLNGGMFILFGLKPLVKEWINIAKQIKQKYQLENAPIYSETDNTMTNNETQNQTYGATTLRDSNDDSDEYLKLDTPQLKLSHKEIMITSAYAALLYFGNCFLGSAALKYTSASNQTVLAASSSVFSLIIGVVFKFEKFTVGKVISVICSMFGILLITFSSTTVPSISAVSSETYGNILALFGACCFSGFLAILRVKLGEQTDSDCDSLVYGYIGFFTYTMGFPLLLLFNFMGWEQLSLPDTYTILFMILSASVLNSLSDFFGSWASLITSPLTVSLSLSAAIPATMFLDSYFMGGSNFTIMYYVGIILIISSFVFTNIENQAEIVDAAIENAIEEAINYDEQLSILLSPNLGPSLSANSPGMIVSDIPGLSIDQNVNDSFSEFGEDEQCHPRLVVTGGQNHKYFFREIKE